jgi:taurine dioxygenase
VAELLLKDLQHAFGVEVKGLDPARELNETECRTLRDAFDDRGVLVIRDLDIDVSYQCYLAGLVVADALPLDRREAESLANPYPFNVSNKQPGGNAPYGRLLYHADMMWADEPMKLLSLYGLHVEQPSVPTIFVSATRAWQTLPGDLRRRAQDLSAVHVTGQQTRGGNPDELLQPIREQIRSAAKPVGHRHPRTGRTILYVSQMMTSRIEGLPREESEELLEALFAHLYSPAHTLQHDWREGDLVLWDNLAIQHARPSVTSDGPERTLRKVIAPKPVLPVDQPETPRFRKAG